jgi:hypothetical protein
MHIDLGIVYACLAAGVRVDVASKR